MRCHLAASWGVDLDDRPMSKHNEFNDLYQQCSNWRRFLLRRWGGFPDIGAEIDASMWEHFCAGVTTERDLFRVVTVDVRRYVRREARVPKLKHRLRMSQLPPVDEVEAIVDRVAALQMVERVEIPSRARPWLSRRLGDTDTDVPVVDQVYARRWAQRTRRVLSHA